MTDQLLTPITLAATPTRWPIPQMRDVLAFCSTALFAFALAAPALFHDKSITLDADLKGAVIMQWATVMGWYFGSSKGSVAKDATIASALTQQPPVAPPEGQ